MGWYFRYPIIMLPDTANRKDLSKDLDQEVIADLQTHPTCLCRKHMAFVGQNLAHDRRATVLVRFVSPESSSCGHSETYKDSNLLLLPAGLNHIIEMSLQYGIKVWTSEM